MLFGSLCSKTFGKADVDSEFPVSLNLQISDPVHFKNQVMTKSEC